MEIIKGSLTLPMEQDFFCGSKCIPPLHPDFSLAGLQSGKLTGSFLLPGP